MPVHRRDHSLLILSNGHIGQLVFHYVRKKTFTIGVGSSCDLLINTAVPSTAFKRTRFCILERRGKSPDTYIKVADGVPVQINGRVPMAGQFLLLPNGAYITVPTTAENSPLKGCITFQYWNIMPGSVFDVFRLLECIGSGGFGTVYDAMHKDSKDRYAVKLIRKVRQLPQRVEEDAVDQEIAILKSISHPAVVNLFDVYSHGHTYFLAMELVPEGSLQDLLKNERRVVDSDAKLVTLDVCAALTYLHAKGIVHRDIKPGNILVLSRTPLSVKVADFGIAKVIDQETYLQTMCGTPDFMAPEITRRGRYDYKVDTWALGVTLFMMLSGRSPFSRRPEMENPYFGIATVGTSDIQWARLPDNSAKPNERRQLISAMLTVEPSDRPAPKEVPLYDWFQDGPVVSASHSGHLHLPASSQVSVMASRLRTLASGPVQPVDAEPPVVPIPRSRSQRTIPSPDSQAER